ncbi:hypothetical protein NLI96_g7616 [Meripilus lineatus]|uniref:CUE domain-containing protein n=1 Tax=Meripilus lineatus TaxID=2056292 RepID=A0AAD5V422_9APHY|nr:hypothetical protein NLI96_g7616 [Physisporinus lineatus]
MGEVVNVLVAFAVIVFIVRWATTGKDSPAERSATSVLGFRPKNVTPEMVETVHGMFPDIPSDNIRYDLLRTGSVQVTSNKLIERGFLPPPPPAYFTLYPRTPANPPPQNNNRPQPAAHPAPASSTTPQETLISRYHLQDRIIDTGASSSVSVTPEEAGGKAVWEDSAEKREASLRERKARMILAARERLLSQQAKDQAATSSSSS